MTHSFKLIVFGMALPLAFAGNSNLAFGDSGSDVSAAYGNLSNAYNQYFNSLMANPGSVRANASTLLNQIVTPAQRAFEGTLDKDVDPSPRSHAPVRPLTAVDVKILKHIKPADPSKAGHIIANGGGAREPAGNYESESPSEGVVVDGSGVPRELTFGSSKSGAPAAKPAGQNTAPSTRSPFDSNPALDPFNIKLPGQAPSQ